LKARFAFQEAKMVFPVSKALQRSIEAYGIKAHFVIAPNAVDTNLFYPNPLPKRQDNFKRLLFVGNLVPVKGMPYLFRALAQLLQKQDDWHLDIVGDGPARSEYESMVKKLGLEDKVTFHGLKFKPEVAEFMRQADLFVLSSVWDNLPCVLAEAMTCGLPIVATDVGGIPEMVDTESGILAKPKDPDSIATAIERALENISVFNRQQIAHKAFERYGYQRVGETLHELYQSIFRLR
jgi:glycosyltransferase involved in cell wall biosynthesis